MNFLHFVLSLLLLCHLPVAAEMSYKKAYLHDPSGRWQISDLQSQAMENYSNDLRLGFRSGAVWIRITVPAHQPVSESETQPYVLRTGPYHLDRIELHQWLKGEWKQQVAGDLINPSDTTRCHDDRYCFRLQLPPNMENTLYVRIKTHGLIAIHTQLVTDQELTAVVAKRMQSITFTLGLAVGFLCISIALLVFRRSRMKLMYFGFQTTVVLFLLVSSGFQSSWLAGLSAEANNLALDLLAVARVAMTVMLGWAVMAPHKAPASYNRCMVILLGACLVNLMLLLAGMAHLALISNVVVFGLNPLVQLWGAVRCTHLGKSRQLILVLGYCAYVVIFALGYWAQVVGTVLQPQPDWIVLLSESRFNGMVVGGFLLALVLVEQSLRERDKQTQIDKLRLEAREAQIATQLYEERRALIDMLTHELKNPLGTMTFAISTLRHKLTSQNHVTQQVNNIDDSIQRMDKLIEHVAVTNKFDGAYIAKAAVILDARNILEGMVYEFADPDRFSLNIEDQACFKADPQLLSVMLENLIQNAFKYGLVKEKINISVKQKAHGLEFEISNPVAADRMPDPKHLFDRYYRHENVQDQPGMGIGLSLVQTVAEKINATVTYRADGEHAVFNVRFNT